jgi:hypothetical protein
MKCPICEKGTLKNVQEKHVLFGIDVGTYPGEKCTACGEIFTESSVMRKIETVAKQKGIWGLGLKTKVARTGNSLAIRIPKPVAEFMKISEGKEAYIHPDGKKLIVELD